MIFEGEYRRFAQLIRGKAAVTARLTHIESSAVDQVAPAQAEMSRAGLRFILGNSAAVTGIAPVQTLPTTAAQWVLWNNNLAASGIAQWYEELGVFLTSGTPGSGGLLLAALIAAPAQVGASVTGVSVTSASGSTKSSALLVKTGVTVTGPTAPNWFPVAQMGPQPGTLAAFPGSTLLEHRNLQGSIVVPPQMGLALAVVAPAGTTPLFAPFAKFAEYASDLE